MTVEEVRRVIVAFLDKFIERGAASDVIELRDRLREHPNAAASEIVSQLQAGDPTPEEAFEAMRALFEAQPTADEPDKADLI